MLASKQLADLTADDLQSLVDSDVRENRITEYKSELPDRAADSVQKFLAGVTSFANTSGGDLIFGITAQDGIPKSVDGLPGVSLDGEMLRLEQVLNSRVEPRIIRPQIRAVPTHAGSPCLVMRIARSLLAPHAVRNGDHFYFYGRGNAGKYPLSLGEIRGAFLASQEIAERVRQFRSERLTTIADGFGPIQLASPFKLLVHIVPADAFDPRASIPLGEDESRLWRLPLLREPAPSTGRYTFDGYLRYTAIENSPLTSNYALIFRNGIIEAGFSRPLHQSQDNKSILALTYYEAQVMQALPKYLNTLQEFGSTPPIFIMVTFDGVLGSYCHFGPNEWDRGDYAIDRNRLMLPEIVLPDATSALGPVMQPAFDALWQAGGASRSRNFAQDGEYRPPSR